MAHADNETTKAIEALVATKQIKLLHSQTDPDAFQLAVTDEAREFLASLGLKPAENMAPKVALGKHRHLFSMYDGPLVGVKSHLLNAGSLNTIPERFSDRAEVVDQFKTLLQNGDIITVTANAEKFSFSHIAANEKGYAFLQQMLGTELPAIDHRALGEHRYVASADRFLISFYSPKPVHEGRVGRVVNLVRKETPTYVPHLNDLLLDELLVRSNINPAKTQLAPEVTPPETLPVPTTEIHEAEAQATIAAPHIGLDPAHVSYKQIVEVLQLLNRKPAMDGKDKIALITKDLTVREALSDDTISLPLPSSLEGRTALAVIKSLIPQGRESVRTHGTYYERGDVAIALNQLAIKAASFMNGDAGSLLLTKLNHIAQHDGPRR